MWEYVVMMTTVEIPDALIRQAKAYAASNGMSLKQFFTEALEEKLWRCAGEAAASAAPPPWMAGVGALADLSQENRRILSLIDDEFEKIAPEDCG